MESNTQVGIIAYGSLIGEPGEELQNLIVGTIDCLTPFPVEYARTSKTRSGAPTLIPVDKGGSKVNAKILVLKNENPLEEVQSMLWRRETGKKNKSYKVPFKPNKDSVIIETISNHSGAEITYYTKIGSNIEGELCGRMLANLAVASILDKAGEENRDGVRYLLNNINNGIITPLTASYKAEILKLADAQTLEQAIEIFDRKRVINPFLKYIIGERKDHLAIALEINAVQDFEQKISIYNRHYGLLTWRGRIYTKDQNGKELNRLICICSNCKTADPEFEYKYGIYESALQKEFEQLGVLTQSSVPFIQKLKVWDAIYDGCTCLIYTFGEKELKLDLKATTTEEIQTENDFRYEKTREHWYLKKSAIPKYHGKDFITQKDRFDQQYVRALRPEELRSKWINVIREDKEMLRDKKAVEFFNRLVDGELISFKSEVFDFETNFSMVAAIENYQMLKYLEEYDQKIINTGNQLLDNTANSVIKELRTQLPELSAEEFNDFSVILQGVLIYVFNCGKYGTYSKAESVTEEQFRDALILSLLHTKEIAANLQKEPSLGGGRVEIVYKDFAVELKVDVKLSDRKKMAVKYVKQPTAYSSALNKPLSILCILDMTSKTNPSAAISNNISIERVPVHGFEQSSDKASRVVMIVIDGKAPVPSKY